MYSPCLTMWNGKQLMCQIFGKKKLHYNPITEHTLHIQREINMASLYSSWSLCALSFHVNHREHFDSCKFLLHTALSRVQ